jgi:hypothetical protein
MLKRTTLLLFFALTSICVNAQNKWFMQKINDKVSVSFPLEPKKLTDNNYGVRDKNDVAFLVSFVELLKVTQMTLEQFNASTITQEFADQFMEGLKPKLAKFTFGNHKIVKVKGNTTYQVSGRSEEMKTNIYMNIVFVDGTSYSLTSLVPDGKPTKEKDIFLSEIYVNGK